MDALDKAEKSASEKIKSAMKTNMVNSLNFSLHVFNSSVIVILSKSKLHKKYSKKHDY